MSTNPNTQAETEDETQSAEATNRSKAEPSDTGEDASSVQDSRIATDGREPLNLRVDSRVKDAYESAIRAEYGTIDTYAGCKLEEELRFRLDDGPLADLWDRVDELADALGQADSEQPTRTPNDRSETTVVRYQIGGRLRARILSHAECEDYRSAGQLVEDVMRSYAQGEDVASRLADRLDRVERAATQQLDDSKTATQRRTEAIVDALDDGGFTLDDFDQAVDEAARGIDSGAYARETYLDRVLNEGGLTWHPNNPNLFVSRDLVDVEEPRDPRGKPHVLTDEADLRLAIKVEATERARATQHGAAALDTGDVVAAVEGRPRTSTIEAAMRTIAADAGGFVFDSDPTAIKVRAAAVERASIDNRETLTILDETDTDQDTEPTTGRSEPPEWVTGASSEVAAIVRNDPSTEGVDELPESVLNNKIAAARGYEPDADGYLPTERVGSAARDRVRSRTRDVLDDGSGAKQAETDADPDRTEERNRHDTDDEETAAGADISDYDDPSTAGGRLDELADATSSAATDGGRVN